MVSIIPPKPNRLNTRNWKKTDRTDRLYVFVDESGDTGLPSHEHSSSCFFINILACNTDGLNKLEKHFGKYRYFRDADKEFKKYRGNRNESQTILNDLCMHLSTIEGIDMYSFYLEKKNYIGPYLNKIRKAEADYDATRFRNFVTRKALEKIFEYVPVVKSVDDNFRSIEIVFDRYLENKEAEENLKEYLNNSYGLPRIQFINQLDSLYCTQLQIVDVIGSIIHPLITEKQKMPFSMIRVFEMNNPDQIKEKDPDTLAGTGSFPSIGS